MRPGQVALGRIAGMAAPAFVVLLVVAGCAQAVAEGTGLCNPGSTVTLYPSGHLKSCRALRDYYSANGIRCNKLGPVGFFDSGKLRNCVLADRATVSGHACNQFGPISFYEDGKLETCVNPP